MKNNSIMIYGAGGHATSVYNLAIDLNLNIDCFIDPFTSLDSKFGRKILSYYDIKSNPKSIVIAIGDNKIRKQIYKSLLKHTNLIFPKLIHPSVYVSRLSNISEGTVIMPGASIGPNCTIGKFCIINSNVSVDHDCEVKDFSSLSPGVTVAGNVNIGESTTIYMNSAIANSVSIGNNAIIGACSFVKDNVADNQINYGIPSKNR